tara:strand:+ start:173 stop:994 length:822 start_codon:yes stop_codon:yes gene_type:complete
MTNVIEYNVSWDECMADMQRPPNEGWIEPSTLLSGSSALAFYGTRTFGDAVQTAITGWDEGRDAMNSGVEFATAKQATFKRPDWEYGVAGQRACIPSYCAGVPNHMVYMDDTSNRNAIPIVKIYADIGATANTEGSAMIRKGSAIVALIDQIEQSGQRVELIACQRTDTKGYGYDEQRIFITVKRADEVLDLDRIAFALAHPSMLRRVCFRIMEFTYPTKVDAYGRVETFRDIPEDAMYIPPMYGNEGYHTMDEALKTVLGHWNECAANTEAA